MSLKRVYELAKEYDMSNRQALSILRSLGVEVKNNLTPLNKRDIERFFTYNNMNKSNVEKFEIKNLHGKYDYEFELKDIVNIIISENGSGKTTILNLFVAILTGNTSKLNNISFDSISITINKEVFQINKKDFMSKQHLKINSELLELLEFHLPANEIKRLNLSYNENGINRKYLRFLLERYKDDLPYYVLSKINDYCFPNNQDIEKNFIGKISKIYSKIEDSVLYLPTYRRIEEEFGNLGFDQDRNIRVIREKKPSIINFGMSDVENRLKELTQKLKDEAMLEYSKMNAEILDDLLTNKIDISKKMDTLLEDEEKIKIVIGRIGKEKIKNHEALFDFIKGTYKIENSNYLRYHLSKLLEIYNRQQNVDEKIKNYRDVCNEYLVNKKIVYDEVLAEVKLSDKYSNTPIEFSKLSSGEKQILSIFSKLYLEEGTKYIIIIDEPELSLSIKWQRKLLPDIIKSRKCSLLLATTHSPFIYQNEYSDNAKDLDYYLVSKRDV